MIQEVGSVICHLDTKKNPFRKIQYIHFHKIKSIIYQIFTVYYKLYNKFVHKAYLALRFSSIPQCLQ